MVHNSCQDSQFVKYFQYLWNDKYKSDEDKEGVLQLGRFAIAINSATFVGSCIFIKGGKPGTKRSVEGEYLTGKDFIAAYDIIRTFDEINTGKVKPYIRRQQTPFMGLLFSAGIIEQDNDIFDRTLI